MLRGAWRGVRLLAHIAGGLWTYHLRFPRLSPAQRQAAVQAWADGMLGKVGITLERHGTPAATGPVLLVANHISWLDIVTMHAARYCRFVSKADIRQWPLVGSMADAAGTLYIQRESRRDAMRVVHQMAESLRAGDAVAVFPEGTTGEGHDDAALPRQPAAGLHRHRHAGATRGHLVHRQPRPGTPRWPPATSVTTRC